LPRFVQLKKTTKDDNAYANKLEETAIYAYDREYLYDYLHSDIDTNSYISSTPFEPETKVVLLEKESIIIEIAPTPTIEEIVTKEAIETTIPPITEPIKTIVETPVKTIEEEVIVELIPEPLIVSEVATIAEVIISEQVEMPISEPIVEINEEIIEAKEESIVEKTELIEEPVLEIKESIVQEEEEEIVQEIVQEKEEVEEIKIEEPKSEPKEEVVLSEQMAEASENSFYQWLRIVEKDRPVEVVSAKPVPVVLSEEKPVVAAKKTFENPMAEAPIKVKKDPELDALDSFVKDQVRQKRKRSLPNHIIEIPFEEMALKSVEEVEVISEGMAKIYMMQHKFDKALVVYEKLISLYPEKSTFFASQINKINSIN
jgi:hypothetical protein